MDRTMYKTLDYGMEISAIDAGNFNFTLTEEDPWIDNKELSEILRNL